MKQLKPINALIRQCRLKEFEEQCKKNGIALTSQRRIIFEVILDMDSHPTADQVHAAPLVRRARISRATVFRTLESFERMGLISKACNPHGVIRYDGRTEQHHHLVCMECDSVIDIAAPELDALPVPDTSALGFEVENFCVQLRGLCRQCKERRKQA